MKYLLSLSNLISYIRIALVPFIVVAIINHDWTRALAFFVPAALSDMFDGLTARYLKEESTFGAFLDPLADKILMMSVFGALVIALPDFPRWFLVLFACRELIIVCGGLWQTYYYPAKPVSPLLIGKITMAAQMVTVGAVLWKVMGGTVFLPPSWCITMTAGLGVISGVAYIARALMGRE